VAGAVHLDLRNDLARIHIDDGKANALSHALIDAVHGALDRAEKEAKAALLAGREGRFCAGFDLAVMRQGGPATGQLVGAGARLAMRLYEFPVPVVVACTGHALAMGAILLLAADERIGAEGDFKIGLNEVAIGMALPGFAIEFARERLSKRHLTRATALGEVYAPAAAVDAGFLDRLEPPGSLLDAAVAEAERLARLPAGAHRHTKRHMRADALARMRQGLDREMKGLAGPTA
jgi:enoyl-CoA hydratase/carnithine racemase